MTIVIIGLHHAIGCVQPEPVGDAIKREQAELRELIEREVRRHGIDFIGEEACGHPTVAKVVADRCGCVYEDLDIPQTVQRQIEYKQATVRAEFLDEYIFAWQLVREWHMYRTFHSHLAGRKAAMIVCGRAHLPGFVKLCSEDNEVIPLCRVTESLTNECYDCCKRAAMLDAKVPTLNLPSKYPHVKGRFEVYCVEERWKL